MRDSATGRSRGFGFLTFRDPKTVNTVMVKEHYLDGKIVRTSFMLIHKHADHGRIISSCWYDRSILSVRSPVMSKRRLARSLLVVSAKRPTNMISKSFLLNLAASSMPP